MIDIHEEEKEIIPLYAKRVYYREMQKRGYKESDKDEKNKPIYLEKYIFTDEEKTRLSQANRYKNKLYISDEHLKIGVYEEWGRWKN